MIKPFRIKLRASGSYCQCRWVECNVLDGSLTLYIRTGAVTAEYHFSAANTDALGRLLSQGGEADHA